MRTTHLLIGGELVEGASTLDVVDPATGEVGTVVARASQDQMEAAVAAARTAYDGWRATPLAERRACVVRLADAIHEHREELAGALVLEQGKPIGEARDEVDWTDGFIRAYAELDVPVEVVHEDDAFRMETHYRPLGVVVGIAPWNFPLFLLTLKLAAATVMGNTFIAKPAPSTPATMVMVGELATDIFPAGVVNVIVDDNDLGPLLTSHPDVAKISFTGSTATGKRIAAAAAASMKRVSLELGGNDASIVLDDVDVDTVAQQLFDAAFLNAGQVCIAVKRIYAQAGVYDALCDALGKLASNANVGSGAAEGVRIGPVQNRMQFEKAQGFLDAARADGVLVHGGDVAASGGFFVTPTVVRDIGPDSYLVREEQFAPILPVVRFDEVDEALALVNDSPYGLGGSVFSGDPERAYEIAGRMDTGTVWVNHHLHLDPRVPVGGAKESGTGADYGVEGLKQYTQATVIRVPKT